MVYEKDDAVTALGHTMDETAEGCPMLRFRSVVAWSVDTSKELLDVSRHHVEDG